MWKVDIRLGESYWFSNPTLNIKWIITFLHAAKIIIHLAEECFKRIM